MQTKIPFHNFHWKSGFYYSYGYDKSFTECKLVHFFIFIHMRPFLTSPKTSNFGTFQFKVRISGENHGILYEASRLETTLHGKVGFNSLRSRVKSRPPHSAFFHHDIPVQAMACTIQRVLSTLNPPPGEILDQLVNNHFGVNEGGRTVEEYDNSQIIGAKMIRIQTRFPTSDEAVDFFNYNFPCAKFIVNTRSNIDEQLQSQKKYFKPADQFDLEKQNQFLYSFAAGLGMDKARLIFTEEWTQNVTALNEVLEWVGFQHCQFRNILHHNQNGYHPDKKTAIKLLGCTDER